MLVSFLQIGIDFYTRSRSLAADPCLIKIKYPHPTPPAPPHTHKKFWNRKNKTEENPCKDLKLLVRIDA